MAPGTDTAAMLIAKSLSKSYPTPQGPLSILANASLQVKRGESVAVMGPSGCGKSTLLYLLGALEPPTGGTITIDGTDPYTLDERAQATFRGAHIGFVFQDHLLLPQLSAIENVLVPTLVATPDAQVRQRADRLLDAVGLTPRRDHRPGELSGGERQRVAIARALVRSPSLLLCDEPTGNLDRASADAVTDLLVALHREQQTVLVVVTHSAAIASRFDRRYELRDAQLQPIA
jgi:lipoprotein-releasing system ATP-binding protein